MPPAATIVLNCAGAGRRLGLGQTKALIDVLGRPLIHWQLDGLVNAGDLRVVVGYNAPDVIDVVLQRRRDAVFVFNHDYATTATGDSLALAARDVAGDVLSIDGDLLIRPGDIGRLLAAPGATLGVTPPMSDDAVLVDIDTGGGGFSATGFFRDRAAAWEWTGLVKCPAAMLVAGSRQRPGPHHVYQLLEHALPFRAIKVETREIDTADDYERAVAWLATEMREGRWT